MATGDVLQSVQVDAELPGEFERLRRFILYHLGGFTLGLVRVNDPSQRDGVIASLTQILAADGAQLIKVDLANRHPANLRVALQTDPAARAALRNPARAVLAIVGLEHLIEAEAGEAGRPPFAAALNVERDALRVALPLPLILFLTDHAMDRLDLTAPDFFDWYSGIFRLRPASAPSPETAISSTSRLAESREPYLSQLSQDTREARLDLLEERRAELERAGPEARLRLGQVLKEIGELYADLPEFHNRQLAVLPLKRAAEIFHEEKQNAEEAAALEKLGTACYWIDDYKQATRRYEAALPIYREIGARLGEANCIKSLGDVHVRLSEYSQARARYEAALPIYREIGDRLGEANCIKSLGDVHVQLSEYSQARARYEAALPIYREIGARLGEANSLTAFGNLSLEEEDYASARDWFDQALRIYRDIGERHSRSYIAPRLSRALLALGEIEVAVQKLGEGADLARAIDGRPNLRSILWLLAQIREGQKDFSAALACYEELVSLAPDTPEYLRSRASTLFELKDYSRALADYSRLAESNVADAWAHNGIGNVLDKRGDFEGAVIAYSQAIAADPDEAVFVRNRASALIALGHLDEARADCETAARLAPDHAYTHGRWSDLHLARGEWAEAETRYRAALAQDDSPGWRFGLAPALWGLGRLDEGWAQFNAALATADAETRAEASRDYHRLLARHPALTVLTEAIERLAQK